MFAAASSEGKIGLAKKKVRVSDKAGAAGEETETRVLTGEGEGEGRGGGTGNQNSPDGCRSYRVSSFHYLYGLNLFHFLVLFFKATEKKTESRKSLYSMK